MVLGDYVQSYSLQLSSLCEGNVEKRNRSVKTDERRNVRNRFI